MARPQNKRETRAGGSSISRAGTLLHWIGMIAMVVGLFAPLFSVDAAATVMSPERTMMKAAQQPFDSDTSRFDRVVLTGDFQEQVGCGAWDTNCDQTRLQNNNGFWTGVFNVPPGNWQWEIVAIDRNGNQYSVDENQVTVSEGDAGLYAEFDSASRDSSVSVATRIATASGPFGTVALAQDGEGFVGSAINVDFDGWVDLQVTVDGQPVQTGANFSRGANRVTFDGLGNITNVQPLGFSEVVVSRVDADGNPLDGSCFVLEGADQSRGCDADDDTSGSITLQFPAGIEPGSYTLRETRPANGAEPLADQQIDVQPGQSTTIEARSEGAPAAETGDLVVLRQDQSGSPVGGACFDLINSNGETVGSACDEDGDVPDDGRIGLLGVPAGDYTLRESRTPEGYEPAADAPVTVFPNQAVDQPVQSNALPAGDTGEETETPVETETETPTDEATETPAEETQFGRVIVYRTDESGTAVGGSCFEVRDQNGQPVGQACDEDGIAADDGTTGIENIPVGSYTVVETRVPTSFQQAPDTPITVNEGDNEFTIAGAAETAPVEEDQTGDLVVRRTNDQNQPVTGTCFDLYDQQGMLVGQQCDGQNPELGEGVVVFRDVPAGTVLLSETQSPEGVEPAGDQQTEIVPNQQNELTVSSLASEEPTAETASLTVNYTWNEGDELACVEISSGSNIIGSFDIPFACDNGENDQNPTAGVIEMINLPVGEFFVDGYMGPDSVTQAELIPVTLSAESPPTVTFDAPAPQVTSFVVTTTDGSAAVSGACYALDGGEPVCDDGSGVTFNDVAPGAHTVVMTSAPDGFNLADPASQEIEVAADGSTTDSFTVARSTTSFTVTTTDGSAAVSGACYTLDGGEPVCDDGSGVTFSNVAPGAHTVVMTTAPDGFNIADPASQEIDVAADGSTTASFTVARSTTSFTVTTTDGSAAVPGACYTLDGGEPICDDGSGVTFSNVAPGAHTVVMTTAPDEFNLADPASQEIDVAADGSTTASFTVARSTTSFTVTTTDGSAAVSGACYTLDGGEPVCDDGSGVTFNDVAPGAHTVVMTSAPDGFNIADPASQEIDVAADGSTTASFTVSASTRTVTVQTTNSETGETLGGACYTLGESEALCDEESTGDVVFPDVPLQDQTLVMTTAPAGFEPAVDEIVPADVSTVSVLLQAEVGSIQVEIVDADSATLPGACVSLDSGDPVCDGDDGAADGAILFENVATGTHSVTLTSVPDGFDMPAEVTQSVDVAANTAAPVTFQLAATAPVTSGLDVTVQYSDESPVNNACVTITHADGTTQFSGCDDADGTVDGKIAFSDLPTGTYSVGLQEGFTPDRPIQTVVPVSADVPAETRGQVTLSLPLAPTTGSVQITTTGDGSNVSGACFDINGSTICDNDGHDLSGTDGVILIDGLDPNDYDVSMSTVPAGFQTPAAQTVTVEAGVTAELQFLLEREVLPGSVTVRTMDQDGTMLGGACYTIVNEGGVETSLCDETSGDGELIFEDVPAGRYQLVQTRTPGSKFQTAPSQFIDVAAGDTTLVEIVMDVRPGRLTVRTVDRDEPTLLLLNACFSLVGDATFGPFCDADDGAVDGQVKFTNIPPGDYELRQTVAAAGYDPAGNRNVTIAPAGSLQITVQNAKTPPPAESGTLQIIPLDPKGNPVAGGCYQVFDGDTPISQRICDNADDTPAQITIENLPVGEFTLREQLAPSPDWQIAADRTVTIRNGETTRVEIPHEYKPGHVVIQAVSTVNLPLQNACFTLSDAGSTELCTDATGQVTVSDLTPGSRQLTQTKAPFGFKLDTTSREVIVRPGQTTTVRVVFQNAPPPNTGTLQVQKFICPAGAEGERTEFLGGAQGNQQLQRTSGCVPGVAGFSLVAENGSTESNANFQTNTDGRAQATAVEGIYILKETSLNLPVNPGARIRIGVGQMTTVIVINYVAPPKPAPVTINVEGYTCPPGFNGSAFADFQNSCMAPSQLTNQITVRAEGASRFKRVTGDTGVVGKTAFTDLPAGTYTIFAERPFTIPVTYLFCGADANNPNLKAVNGSVSTTQQSGTTITCRVFQVPSLFDANNGAIQVQKFNCPINERQRGYDYKNECSRATEPIPFEVQQVDPKTRAAIGRPIRLSTNGDGIAQFPMLVPGTYKLTEVNGEWCFAQSNSVDAQGDVLVTRNKLSEVWIYNCIGTKSPPNTGSGDAADILNPDGGVSPMQVVPNLIWPTVLAAGWIVWRDRKQA